MTSRGSLIQVQTRKASRGACMRHSQESETDTPTQQADSSLYLNDSSWGGGVLMLVFTAIMMQFPQEYEAV